MQKAIVGVLVLTVSSSTSAQSLLHGRTEVGDGSCAGLTTRGTLSFEGPCGNGGVGLAMDGKSGAIYTANPGSHAFEVFAFDGSSQLMAGVPLGSRQVVGISPDSFGFDAAGGLLWGADGTQYGAWDFSSPPSECGEAAVPLVYGPLVLPAGFSSIQDLDWDPFSGSLWIATNNEIVNVDVSGTVLSSFVVPVNYGVRGLAFDSASPFGGHMYVLDSHIVFGASIYSYLPDGSVAPDTTSLRHGFSVSEGADDLGFAPRGAFYQVGFDADDPADWPFLITDGTTRSPNPSFSHVFLGGEMGSFVVLAVSGGNFCPPATIFGAPIYVDPGQFVVVASGVLSSTGIGIWSTPIPPGVSVGEELVSQVVAFKPSGSVEVSNPLVSRISL